jgi:hypothetical protein
MSITGNEQQLHHPQRICQQVDAKCCSVQSPASTSALPEAGEDGHKQALADVA